MRILFDDSLYILPSTYNIPVRPCTIARAQFRDYVTNVWIGHGGTTVKHPAIVTGANTKLHCYGAVVDWDKHRKYLQSNSSTGLFSVKYSIFSPLSCISYHHLKLQYGLYTVPTAAYRVERIWLPLRSQWRRLCCYANNLTIVVGYFVFFSSSAACPQFNTYW